MSKETDGYRDKVLRKLAGENQCRKDGRVTYLIAEKRFHIKVKTGELEKYPFNINDAVLSADYEVVICGKDVCYYVLPISLVRQMHTDPLAMYDRRNEDKGYTIYDVYPQQNRIVFGTGGKSIDIAKYRNLTLNRSGQLV